MFQQLTRFFLFASIFCVLIVATGTFFPFIGGKYYFFRIITEFAAIAALLHWAFEAKTGEIERRFMALFRNPLVVCVSVFVGAFLLSSLLADNMSAAFWSNYERGDGGFQMIHYYLFFILSLIFFRTSEDWRRLFSLSLVAAALMIFYGVLSGLGAPSFIGPYINSQQAFSLRSFIHDMFTLRFQGSLGNPAYVAPYLLFSMFYALWLFWTGQRTRNRMLAYGSLVALFFLFFVLSQTRAVFLALLIAVVFAFLYVLVRNARTRRTTGAILGGLVLVYAILFSFRAPLIERNVFGSRFLDVSISSDTLQTRFWTWGSAWKGFLEHPVFGWGPENFTTVFDKYFDHRHFDPNRATETWFDRAHSVIFDYLTETGLVGLLSYLSMFVCLLMLFFRQVIRGAGVSHDPSSTPDHFRSTIFKSTILQAIFLALPLAYLIQGLALFDVLPIYLNLFLFFAFCSFLFQPHGASAGRPSSDV